MPLGCIVDPPITSYAEQWRGIFMMINCDSVSTEPGRKKLHVDDEKTVRDVAKKVFNKLQKYSHYFLPRDGSGLFESLRRDVEANLQAVKSHREDHPLINRKASISIAVEPINEQTLIALFHELIGAGALRGYKALKLSATETYDGIYEYEISSEDVGREYWKEWLRQHKARERQEIEESKIYRAGEIVVEFKMRLQDVIKDFQRNIKYHPDIKLLVAWEADRDVIRKQGWLLDDLHKPAQRFYGASWRLQPSVEASAKKAIQPIDVLLLKDFLSQG